MSGRSKKILTKYGDRFLQKIMPESFCFSHSDLILSDLKFKLKACKQNFFSDKVKNLKVISLKCSKEV